MELKTRRRGSLYTITAANMLRWIAWSLFVLGGLASADNSSSMEITPNKTIITKSIGETLELYCRGDVSVTWNNTLYEFDDRVTLKHGENKTGEKRFWATFTLQSITVFDIGFYSCQYNSSYDFTDDGPTGKQIYLMVDDKENLLVNPDRSQEHIIVNARSGQPYTIPCKPTSNAVHLEIFKDHVKLQLSNSKTYDPTIGYTINPIVTTSIATYTCNGTLGKVTQTIHYILHYIVTSNKDLVKPTINTESDIVSLGQILTLDCKVQHDSTIFYILNWTDPSSVLNSGRTEIINEWVSDARQEYRSRLMVYNVTKEDSGNYTCIVKGAHGPMRSASREINVYGEKDRFLNVTTRSEKIEVREYDTARWVINVTSYPTKRNCRWTKDGVEFEENDPYFRKDERRSEVVLQKVNAMLTDAGSYQFIVEISEFPELRRVLNLTLVVTSVPFTYIEPVLKYFVDDEMYLLTCSAEGFPIPSIQWSYRSCSNFSNLSYCSEVNPLLDDQMNPTIVEYQKSSRSINITANQHRRYECQANNFRGNNTTTVNIQVVDFPGGNNYGIIAPDRFIEGDSVNLTCGASKLDYGGKISWYRKLSSSSSWQNITTNVSNIIVNDMETTWSWQKFILINAITIQDSGEYMCIIIDDGKFTHNQTQTIFVEKTAIPIITSTNLTGGTVTIKEGDPDVKQFQLYCYTDGVPPPVISWFRNGEPLEMWPPEIEYTLSKNNTNLTFDYIREAATGEYKCESKSRAGSTEKTMIVEVIGPSRSLHVGFIVFLVIIIIAVFGLAACLAKKIRKEKNIAREIGNLLKDDFEKGAISNINPELGVQDQANLLPYDRKWEFPKDRIKLGMQLGSGAFGRVFKAEAMGILKNESVTEVAVKMVKANADESHIAALMSELKIMVHLGQHVNVVNLLGACTENLSKKRELLVIVEYCKYGSLLSYLHRHKHSFINQLDPVQDVIDPSICTPEDVNHANLANNQNQAPNLSYATLMFTDNENRKVAPNGYRTLEEIGPVPQVAQPIVFPLRSPDYNPNCNSASEGYNTGGNMQSVCTDMSYVSNCPSFIDTEGKRRSSSGSTCAGHYRGDYQHRDVPAMTTKSLLSWSFQIARGMEYLASRKILHGDLAARNVLLAEDNVVKICDFGLSKDMYKGYKYKKKSEGVLLPVKWMAIESIYFAEFSTQSDAWSFGVVLWEIFTLGKTPYPGMEADDRFYKMLSDGYRMEKPPLAPSAIYDLMVNCWASEPSSRPTFSALADRIGDLMEDSLRQHYIDLNTSFDKNNKLRLQSNPDYLATMSGPEFKIVNEQPAEPTYTNLPMDVNGVQLMLPSPQKPSENGYQNVKMDMENPDEGRLQPLAENLGYMYLKPSSDGDEVQMNSSTFSKAGMVNNDGYCLTNFPPNSPGPHDVFSPRPMNPKTNLEFNFIHTARNGDNHEPDRANCYPTTVPGHSNSNSPSKEISGISNLNYIPNNMIFPQDMKELNDVLLDISQKSTSPKRQKNDSGVSSLGSNGENKSPTPPICSNGDSNCDTDMLPNRDSCIISHENENGEVGHTKDQQEKMHEESIFSEQKNSPKKPAEFSQNLYPLTLI